MRAVLMIAVMLVGVALTLAAAGAMYLMTNSIQEMESPLTRGLAVAATLVMGVLLLVASVLVSVKLAVAVGARPDDNPPTARIDTLYMQQQMKARRERMEGRKHGHQ